MLMCSDIGYMPKPPIGLMPYQVNSLCQTNQILMGTRCMIKGNPSIKYCLDISQVCALLDLQAVVSLSNVVFTTTNTDTGEVSFTVSSVDPTPPTVTGVTVTFTLADGTPLSVVTFPLFSLKELVKSLSFPLDRSMSCQRENLLPLIDL